MPRVRKSYSKYIFIFFLIVFGSLTVGYITFEIMKSINVFEIDNVVVEGQNLELSFDIEEFLNKYNDENLFSIDRESGEGDLIDNFPVVQNCKFYRKLPNELLVKYDIRKPILAINYNNRNFYYIDRELTLLEDLNEGYLDNSVPIIIASAQDTNNVFGENINDDEIVRLKNYYDKLVSANPSFANKISDMFIKDDYCLIRDIYTASVINFGEEDLAYKIDLYEKYSSSYCEDLYIDFTFKDRIITRKNKY